MDSHEVTGLLKAWSRGEASALGRLIPLVHDELRRVARGCMRGERANHSLQPTALVHEAFLRIVEIKETDWQNRAHFLSMSARLMRRVLVDIARARRARKRGGGALRVTFDEALLSGPAKDIDLERLDGALNALASLDERKSRVVEMKFFGGLSVDETAQVLQVSSKTVMRDWSFSKAWLKRELRREGKR